MMTTILSNLNQKLAQLDAGNLTQDEMELLVEDAKELYERLVILRYKIYETNVLGPRKEVIEEPVFSMPSEEAEAVGHMEAPSFDLFEMETEAPELEISTEITMDFTADSSTSEAVETDLFVELTEDEPEDSLFEERPEEMHIEELASPDSNDEEDLTKEENEQVEQVVVEEASALFEEETPVEEHTTDTSENSTVAHDESIHGAWILQIEQSIRADRSVFPLETLIGSFSLNEKLQFINELFDGSSDAFSSATKKLDACASMAEARNLMTEFSSSYEWDLDSEIVEDFIFKICRRYATSAS